MSTELEELRMSFRGLSDDDEEEGLEYGEDDKGIKEGEEEEEWEEEESADGGSVE